MKSNTADELHIEVDHVPNEWLIANRPRSIPKTASRIFDGGERLRQERVQSLGQHIRILDRGQFLLPSQALGLELGVTKRLILLLNPIDLFDQWTESSNFALVF